MFWCRKRQGQTDLDQPDAKWVPRRVPARGWRRREGDGCTPGRRVWLRNPPPNPNSALPSGKALGQQSIRPWAGSRRDGCRAEGTSAEWGAPGQRGKLLKRMATSPREAAQSSSRRSWKEMQRDAICPAGSRGEVRLGGESRGGHSAP